MKWWGSILLSQPYSASGAPMERGRIQDQQTQKHFEKNKHEHHNSQEIATENIQILCRGLPVETAG